MKDSEVSKAKGKSLRFNPSTEPPLVIESTVKHINAVAQSRSGEIIRTIPISLPRVKFLERREV